MHDAETGNWGNIFSGPRDYPPAPSVPSPVVKPASTAAQKPKFEWEKYQIVCDVLDRHQNYKKMSSLTINVKVEPSRFRLPRVDRATIGDDSHWPFLSSEPMRVAVRYYKTDTATGKCSVPVFENEGYGQVCMFRMTGLETANIAAIESQFLNKGLPVPLPSLKAGASSLEKPYKERYLQENESGVLGHIIRSYSKEPNRIAYFLSHPIQCGARPE
jgi:hypothetical protein